MTTDVATQLRSGVMIPAHPLALDAGGQPDMRAQRALTRYYLDAGVHGLAVGVHTTQFELHNDRQLLTDVWSLAADTARAHRPADDQPLLIAGLTGDTPDAVVEAQIAADLGYQAALLSPWGMSDRGEDVLLERAAAVAQVMPVIGFYLQESVGGAPLSRAFWQGLFDIEAVVAVKTAPFDRYRTNDVAQVILAHDRWAEIALLTGNDDAIVHDLLTPYRRSVSGSERQVRATGGLLGQWAVGARAAVDLVGRAGQAVRAGSVPLGLLAEASAITDINAAVFDVDNDFAGCVPGVNEVLRQQHLVPTANCLGPDVLSPGQTELITQVRQRYPDLLDEEFVAQRRDAWLA